MTATRVLQWGGERARVGPWRGDPSVAQLTPIPGSPAPSAAFVQRCLTSIAQQGYQRVVTGALTPAEQAGFLRAGFSIAEHLHLLAHNLRSLPVAPAAELRRAARTTRAAVLEVDNAAFSTFWRLDETSLEDALRATPHTRFRVGLAGTSVVSYAIVGRSARRGYLQRLAVRPDHESRGLGRALVIDGLRWLRRWRVEEAFVNTQHENQRALELYEQLGFRRQASGLTVLGIDLP